MAGRSGIGALLHLMEMAFGRLRAQGRLNWSDTEVQPWPAGEAPMPETIDWLVTVHNRLVAHVQDLADDTELDRPRRANWGDEWLTRSIIGAMITHDGYHAGGINHLRSTLGTDDRWQYIKDGFG